MSLSLRPVAVAIDLGGLSIHPIVRRTRLVGTPLVAVIFVGALGSVFWLDLVYGALLVLGVPALLKT